MMKTIGAMLCLFCVTLVACSGNLQRPDNDSYIDTTADRDGSHNADGSVDSTLSDASSVLDASSMLDASSVLDGSSMLPDTSSVLPDASSVLPDASSVLPDTSSVLPDATSVLPDATVPSDSAPGACPPGYDWDGTTCNGEIVAGCHLANHTYYVNPKHPNAASGMNFRIFGTPKIINQGYGAKSKPFGSISEALYQVGLNRPCGRIFVAPGVYRENVYLAGRKHMRFIADTTGAYTGTSPGEVLVTGAVAINESAFNAYKPTTYKNVWIYIDLHDTQGDPACLPVKDQGTQPNGCKLSSVVQAKGLAQHRHRPYTKVSTVAQVAQKAGSYTYVLRQQPGAPPELDLYIHTFDSAKPLESTHALEYVPLRSPVTWDTIYFHRHRHCFDMEGGSENLHIIGFTCRNTWSAGIGLFGPRHVIRDNVVSGSGNYGIWIDLRSAPQPSEPVDIQRNQISYAAKGGILNLGYDLVLVNNVLHNHPYGLRVIVSPKVQSKPTVFAAHNTIAKNGIGITLGDATTKVAIDWIATNNNIAFNTSKAMLSYVDKTKGSYNASHNNWYGVSFGASTGIEQALRNDNPKFLSANTYNFSISTTSQLVDAGRSTGLGKFDLPSNDILEKTRPLGSGYDIGAYEVK